MMSFLGLYRVKVIGTKVCPKEPVPPVIKIEEFDSILFKRVGGAAVVRVNLPQAQSALCSAHYRLIYALRALVSG